MKYKTVQEKITAIYSWALKNHASAKEAAEKTSNVIENAMLQGKAKAYMDVACCVKGKYGKYILAE
jgi:hypothetical protein